MKLMDSCKICSTSNNALSITSHQFEICRIAKGEALLLLLLLLLPLLFFLFNFRFVTSAMMQAFSM